MRRSTIARHLPAPGLAALLCVSVSGMAGAQSPTPSIQSAAPVGTITWKINTKGQDFDKDPIATGVAQGPDGTVYISGLVVDQAGVPTVAFWYSQNLKKWTRSLIDDPPGSGATSIVANPAVPQQALMEDARPGTGGFSAVGASTEGAMVWSWADERRWVSQVLPGTSFVDLAASETGLHTVGQLNTGPTGQPAMWSAPDSLTWAGTTIAGAGQPQAMARSADGGFVVGGIVTAADGTPQATIWHSTDGAVFTQVESEVLVGLTSVIALEWTPVGFVLAASDMDTDTETGSVLVSRDGLQWQRTLDVPDGRITALGTAGTDAIAIGNDRTWRSADGVTWQETSVPAFRGYTINAVSILSDGRLLAVGRLEGKKGARIATWIGTNRPVALPADASAAPGATLSPPA